MLLSGDPSESGGGDGRYAAAGGDVTLTDVVQQPPIYPNSEGVQMESRRYQTNVVQEPPTYPEHLRPGDVTLLSGDPIESGSSNGGRQVAPSGDVAPLHVIHDPPTYPNYLRPGDVTLLSSQVGSPPPEGPGSGTNGMDDRSGEAISPLDAKASPILFSRRTVGGTIDPSGDLTLLGGDPKLGSTGSGNGRQVAPSGDRATGVSLMASAGGAAGGDIIR